MYIQGDPDQDANPLGGDSLVHKTKKIVLEEGGGHFAPRSSNNGFSGGTFAKKVTSLTGLLLLT